MPKKISSEDLLTELCLERAELVNEVNVLAILYRQKSRFLTLQNGDIFEERSKQLFTAFPKLKAFGWQQFLLLDGFEEEDEFSGVLSDDLCIQYGNETTLDTVEFITNPSELQKEREAAAGAVHQLLTSFDEHDLMGLFGLNTFVTATRGRNNKPKIKVDGDGNSQL